VVHLPIAIGRGVWAASTDPPAPERTVWETYKGPKGNSKEKRKCEPMRVCGEDSQLGVADRNGANLGRSLTCTHEDDRSRLARGADLLTSELEAILTYLEMGK
jgi:hypothetical protein